MGRYGAKETAEETKSLDINCLQRKGLLVPGLSYSFSWRRGDEPIGSIGVRSEQSSLVLEYRWSPPAGEWESVTERVCLNSTACNYGGHRPWFMCPRCTRRVGKLFMAGKYFFCRHCYRLAYESQREDAYGRLLRKVRKIRSRVGGSSSLLDPFPPRPKGMHETTYRRLGLEAEGAEWKLDARFVEMVDRFIRCSDRVRRRLE